MRLTIAYVCCKFHKNRFYSKKVMAVSCPYVTMFVDFSASVSTGARGGRRQHRGELTGAGGTLDGVSSPHSAFSKVVYSLQPIWTKLGTPTGGPRKEAPTNFEENPTTLCGVQRLKAKMTRENLADVDKIYRIFVSMYYTRFLKIWRESN